MEYTFEQTREGWTVWRVVTLSDKRTERTKVTTYIYESDADDVAHELNERADREVEA